MVYLTTYMNCCVNTLICWLAGCQKQLCVIKGIKTTLLTVWLTTAEIAARRETSSNIMGYRRPGQYFYN